MECRKGIFKPIFGVLCILLCVILCRMAWAFDEEMFYDYAVYSALYMYQQEELGHAMETDEYMQAMKKRYPEFMNTKWKAFGQRIARSPDAQIQFCEKVVRRLEDRGYNSEMVEITQGMYTVSIVGKIEHLD